MTHSSSEHGPAESLGVPVSDAESDDYADAQDRKDAPIEDLTTSFRMQTSFIRTEGKDVYNRLKSIQEDAGFVQHVKDAYPSLPLIPNLRCGLWYCDAPSSIPPAYFKSTDGHTGNWSFNLRRPNLHLLPLIAEAGGIMLVDSTRRGKLMPDALSKSVPIWCAVINAALGLNSDNEGAEDCSPTFLFTPPAVVSPSEHDQIAQRIPVWAAALLASDLRLPPLTKPLRPFWVTPATKHLPVLDPAGDLYPVICISASKVAPDGIERRGGYAYVQGAGDDHEAWSQGLTPQLYWKHKAELEACTRTELPTVIRELVQHVPELVPSTPSPIHAVHSVLLVGKHPVPINAADLTILILPPSASSTEEFPSLLRLTLPVGYRAHVAFLSSILPTALSRIRTALSGGKTVCIACSTGNDVSVGVTVAALQSFFSDTGALDLTDSEVKAPATKASLARRLQWVLQARPEANPSRATLKRVNEWFMSPTRHGGGGR